MRRKIVLTLFSFVLGFGVVEAWKVGFRRAPHAPAPESVPFVAHATLISMTQDGYVPLTITKILAQRKDGSYYESQTNLNHNRNRSVTAHTIWDSASGRRTLVFPEARATTSYRFERDRLTSVGCRDDILAYPDAGEFLGLAVVEKVRDVPIEGGRQQTRTLYAPELNCLIVSDEARWIDADGGMVSMSVYKVDTLTLAEPDSALFKIPSDYEELSPSRAWARALTSVDPETAAADIDDLNGERFARADAEYAERSWASRR